MGYYINPPDKSKEAWLQENASKTHVGTPHFHAVPSDSCLVCLVDNGPFTAAAIAYSHNEFNAFTSPGDNRRKTWFTIPKDKLIAICPDYACSQPS